MRKRELALLVAIFSFSAIAQDIGKSAHGTCAVWVYTHRIASVAIDSFLTPFSTDGPCAIKHPQVCKFVRPTPQLLIAVTGTYGEYLADNTFWNTRDEVRSVFKSMKGDISVPEMQTNADIFFETLVREYRSHGLPERFRAAKGAVPVVELMILARVKGEPDGLRYRIEFENGKFNHSSTIDFLRPAFTSNVQFVGSCRDNIVRYGEDKAVDPPIPFSQFELRQLRIDRDISSSLENLVTLTRSYETALSRISSEQNKCYVGGAISIATLDQSTDEWESDSAICKSEFKPGSVNSHVAHKIR